MAWPTAPSDGQIIYAALISDIITALGSWGGNVAANDHNLSNLGTLTFGAAGGFAAGTVSAPGVRQDSDQDTGILWPTANTIQVATGGTARVTIDSTGVGIGRTATAKLDVYAASGSPEIKLESGGSTDMGIRLKDASREYKLAINAAGLGAGKFSIYSITAGRHLIALDDTAIYMYLGGTLKTLSVDGSGFVKAT